MKKITLTIAAIAAAFTMNAQDSCADAEEITVGVDDNTTISVDPLAGDALGADACVTVQGATSQNGAWYTYTPSQDVFVTLTTDAVQAQTDYYPVMQVFGGDCSNLECLNADWFGSNGSETDPNLFAEIEFVAESGVTYYIHFDDLYAQTGAGGTPSFNFEITTSTDMPEAPGIATNPTPEDGATGVGISTLETGETAMNFAWDAPQGDDVDFYTIVISVDPNFPQESTISGDFESNSIEGLYLPGQQYFEEDMTYYWMVIPTNSGGFPDEADIEVWSFTTGTLGVDDMNQNQFSHYVSNGQLNLSANAPIESVELYSILGQQVVAEKLSNNNNESINISQLQTGVYLAKVQVEGKVKTFKFVK